MKEERRKNELSAKEAECIVNYLSAEDKEIAEKAAKLIVRDYGEVIKKLEEA